MIFCPVVKEITLTLIKVILRVRQCVSIKYDFYTYIRYSFDFVFSVKSYKM